MMKPRRRANTRTPGVALTAAALALCAAGSVAWSLGRPAPSPAETSVPESADAAGLSPEAVRRILEEEARRGGAGALLEVALHYQQAGEGATAFKTLQKVARAHPGFARGRQYLGVAYLSLGRPADARKELSAAVNLASHETEARVYLGMALEALGDTTAALAQYRRAQETDPDAPGPYLALAQVDRGPAGYEDALHNIEKHLARTSRPGPGYHLKAQILAHRGQRGPALDYARRAVEEEPQNGGFWRYLGRLHHGMGGPEALPAAARCYHQALRLNGADGVVWFDLGRVYASAHRWQDAIPAFERARRYGTGDGQVHYHLAQALKAGGRREEAERELARYRAYLESTGRRKRGREAPTRAEGRPAP
jgi:tetratricopeptide (TPR) repeat protein